MALNPLVTAITQKSIEYRNSNIKDVFVNKELFDVSKKISENKDTLTEKEIRKIYKKHCDNNFLVGMLFECKNLPDDIVKTELKKGLFTNQPVTENADNISSIFFANIDKNIIKRNIMEFTKTLLEPSNLYFIDYSQINARLLLECAIEQSQNINNFKFRYHPPNNLMAYLHTDLHLSSKQIEQRLYKVVSKSNISSLPNVDLSDVEERFAHIYKSKFSSDRIKDAIKEKHGFPVMELVDVLSKEEMLNFYEAVTIEIFEKGDTDYCNFAQYTDIFKNPNFTKSFIKDFSNRMASGLSTLSTKGINAPYRYLESGVIHLVEKRGKEMDFEDVLNIYNAKDNYINTFLFENAELNNDVMEQLSKVYVAETKKKNICQSNSVFMHRLSFCCKYTSLRDETYEQVFKKELPSIRYRTLKQNILYSPTTPEKYLKDHLYRNADLKTALALFGKENNLSYNTIAKLSDAISQGAFDTTGPLKSIEASWNKIAPFKELEKQGLFNIDMFNDFINRLYDSHPNLNLYFGAKVENFINFYKYCEEPNFETLLINKYPIKYHTKNKNEYIKNLVKNDNGVISPMDLYRVITTDDTYKNLCAKVDEIKRKEIKEKSIGIEI